MASLHDLAHQSGFVFEAQVEKLGASTATGYAAVDETAIVRITRIVKSTPALSGYEGQQITVHLQAPVSLKEGQQAVFFTHGAHYGDGLVLAEIGHAKGGAGEMADELNSAVHAGNLAEMSQRLAQADLVVSGVASAPKRYEPPAAAAAAPRHVSEHDPDWHVSTITIDKVEKGVHSEKKVDVFFPNSMDIAWYRSPKVKQGDRGVWLLHNRDVHGRAVPGRAVTHPLDFRPAAEAELVRSLLQ